jgi:membrane protein DedA with SNARE-associated domain
MLMFGIVGLPIPDETLLTFTGYLAFSGHLSLVAAYFTALAGSACGITVSYTLGRMFGLVLIHRYGRYLHIRVEHVERAHAWFRKAGHWGLTFGYFIPGVRHLTAYAAGMSELEPPQFALFAYSGACLWVATFVGLGYFLGDRWKAVQQNVDPYLKGLGIALAVAAAGYVAWRVGKSRGWW